MWRYESYFYKINAWLWSTKSHSYFEFKIKNAFIAVLSYDTTPTNLLLGAKTIKDYLNNVPHFNIWFAPLLKD